MPRMYRIAVIGHTGRGNYGHGLDVAWRQVPNTQIVAVADANADGLAAAQKRLGVTQGYADYREMLKKERPHIVTIAPRFLDEHRDMVLACAEAGASIFMEKPFCRDLTEADEMVAACEKHHVKLAIAHQTRHSPKVLRIKEMIAAGQIGDLMEIRCRGKEDSRVGGVDLMVLGSHLMDLMRIFAGDPKTCYSQIAVSEKENFRPAVRADIKPGGEGMGNVLGEHIHAMFTFDRGVVGYFASQKVAPVKENPGSRFHLSLYGSRGIIQVQTGSLPPAAYLADASWFPARSKAGWQEITSAGIGKPETLKDGGLVEGNVWVIRDLLEAIEKDRQPLGGPHDARWTIEMIMGIYQSHMTKTAVDLPLKNRRHPLA
jgi:predicted dehydrogenase